MNKIEEIIEGVLTHRIRRSELIVLLAELNHSSSEEEDRRVAASAASKILSRENSDKQLKSQYEQSGERG